MAGFLYSMLLMSVSGTIMFLLATLLYKQTKSKYARWYYALIITSVLLFILPLHGLFPDTENHWSRDAVNYLVSADIIHGYEDGLFRPDKDISYYEAVNLVMSIMGYTSFMFNEKTMETAMNVGLLDGLGSFTNETPIPRIEFARLIANAYDKNMYVVKVNFEARRPSFEFLADITLGQYYEGQELVNGILFHTPTACQQWQNDYEDEYYILYDSILDDEEKELHRQTVVERENG